MLKFQIFYDRKKEFRWRLLGKNNRVIAVAGESFTRKANCKKSIKALTSPLIAAASQVVEDKTIAPKKKKK